MKRQVRTIVLAATGAVAGFVLGIGMPVAGADNTLTFDSNGVVAGTVADGTAPANAANGGVQTGTDSNLPGQSTGDVGYCVGILFRAQCSGGASPSPGSNPIPGPVPSPVPNPGATPGTPGSTPGGSPTPSPTPIPGPVPGSGNTGGTANGGVNGTVGATVNGTSVAGASVNANGKGSADADANAGPASASAQVPATGSCADTTSGLLSAETDGPVSSDLLVGGGLAGSLLAGGLAIRRRFGA
jgi:hypothetical protein